MNKHTWLILILVFYVILTPVVYASDEDAVNVSEFPDRLAEMMGIPLFAAQILASGLVLSSFLLPTIFACSKFRKDVVIPSVFVGFTALSLCIALAWLPVWLLLVVTLTLAFAYMDKIKGIVRS